MSKLPYRNKPENVKLREEAADRSNEMQVEASRGKQAAAVCQGKHMINFTRLLNYGNSSTWKLISAY